MKVEQKSIKFDVKALNEDGTFEGYASVYGNVDSYGEVVEKGAFKRTLDQKGSEIVLLWYHDPTQPIGLGNVAEDDYGLYLKGQLDLDTEAGKTAYSRMRKKIVKGLSIGYRVVRDMVETGKRKLLELDLREVSLVTFPANSLATVTAVKAGRVLSAKNRSAIDAAIASLQQLLAEADPPEDNAGSSDSGKSHSDDTEGKKRDSEELHSLLDSLTTVIRGAS